MLQVSPTTLRGDTVKPLQGEDGLYRIGDYRLVHRARPSARVVEVITFAARGSVYA